jgi:hypothetical protein
MPVILRCIFCATSPLTVDSDNTPRVLRACRHVEKVSRLTVKRTHSSRSFNIAWTAEDSDVVHNDCTVAA